MTVPDRMTDSLSLSHRVEISWGTGMLPGEPTGEVLKGWLITAMELLKCTASEASVRIVSAREMINLNTTYRNTPGITNVLSFENGMTDDGGVVLLGDIVICSAKVLEESEQFQKTFTGRYAHLLVHGLLHLLGHDHIDDHEREIMEAQETFLVRQLGFDDPYEVTGR